MSWNFERGAIFLEGILWNFKNSWFKRYFAPSVCLLTDSKIHKVTITWHHSIVSIKWSWIPASESSLESSFSIHNLILSIKSKRKLPNCKRSLLDLVPTLWSKFTRKSIFRRKLVRCLKKTRLLCPFVQSRLS